MYSFDSKVRYSESDRRGKITLGAILDYFQDCSTFQSEELGIGVDYLLAQREGWILASWQVQILRYVDANEEITISTWPYKLRGCFGYRNFSMRDREGNIVAVADSIWVLLDIDTVRPKKVTEEIAEKYTLSPRYDMEDAGRKIPIPQELTEQEGFRIRRSDIDTNGHVNNANYIKIAMEYLPADKAVKQVRVEYKEAAYEGGRFLPYTGWQDGKFYVVLKDQSGTVNATCEFVVE